jgi:hypothetical protein
MSSDALPDDPGTLKAMLLAERMQNERLRQIIKELQRHRFGRRTETLPEDQMLLGLEDVEQSWLAMMRKPMTPAEQSARAERRRSNLGSLPAHLPRVEMIVDSDDKTCRAASASCTALAKTGASGSIPCRHSSGCSSP